MPFFSLFTQRNYTLNTEAGSTITRDQYGTLHFRDSGLKNGSKLIMKPQQRERAEASNEQMADSEEAEEAAGEEDAGVAGEGGEDEMIEMCEGGEDE